MTNQVGSVETAVLVGHHSKPMRGGVSMTGNMLAKIILSITACAGLVTPLQAHPQDCSSFAEDIINKFGNIPTGGQGEIQVNMVSNRSDGRYVSYGEMPSVSGNNGGTGPFVYHPATRFVPAYLRGTLSQFFSDRRFNLVDSGFGGTSDPFNPQATDSLGVVIYLGSRVSFPPGTDITPGEVVFTLNSWGGAVYSFRGQCQDGMINGSIGNEEFILSLFNQSVIPPPAPIH